VSIDFALPHLERFGPVVMAGIKRSHRLPRERLDSYRDVASQWRAVVQIARDMPHLPPERGYGVGLAMADGAAVLDYFCGFAVAGPERVPEPLSMLTIGPVTCAVVAHHDHISRLRSTLEFVYATVLPMAGLEAASGPQTPDFIQRYHDSFDPATGLGDIDVMVPVKV
jgi:predicted transcriptional regulator YdeE